MSETRQRHVVVVVVAVFTTVIITYIIQVTIPNLDDVRVTSVTSEMTSDRNIRF